VVANKVIFLDRRGMAPLSEDKIEGGGEEKLEGSSGGEEKLEGSSGAELEPDDIPF
jgi:hypothetical protein